MFSSPSSEITIPVLGLYYKVAIFEPELREYDSFTRLVLQSCDFRAELQEYDSFTTTKLRCSSPSSGSTIPLLLQSCDVRARAPGVRFLYYYKVAMFEPELREYDSFIGLYYKVAIFEPELREYDSFTGVVLTQKLQSEQFLLQIKGDPLSNTSRIQNSKLSTWI